MVEIPRPPGELAGACPGTGDTLPRERCGKKDERLLTFDVTEPGIAPGETGGRAAFKAQAAPKAKLSPEHMEVGPTKFGGRFPLKY